MDFNKEQKQGGLKIRIGTSGKKEPYATLDIMTSTIDSIVGEMSQDQAFGAMKRSEERTDIIPNPTYGYLGGVYWIAIS